MINKASIEDISTINNLGSLLYNNFNNIYNILYYIEDNNNYEVLIYKEDIIKGFLILYNNIDYIELLVIVVDPLYRRVGIASKLLDYIINKYNKSIILEVATNNLDAINLYKKFNFIEVGIRKKYYNNLIDAYIMKLVKDEK